MTTDNFPEHEKLQKISHLSQTVGEFIDWLSQRGYSICKRMTCGAGFDIYGDEIKKWFPVCRSINVWLEEYFEIDGVVLEQEKRQILAQIREMNE